MIVLVRSRHKPGSCINNRLSCLVISGFLLRVSDGAKKKSCPAVLGCILVCSYINFYE